MGFGAGGGSQQRRPPTRSAGPSPGHLLAADGSGRGGAWRPASRPPRAATGPGSARPSSGVTQPRAGPGRSGVGGGASAARRQHGGPAEHGRRGAWRRPSRAGGRRCGPEPRAPGLHLGQRRLRPASGSGRGGPARTWDAGPHPAPPCPPRPGRPLTAVTQAPGSCPPARPSRPRGVARSRGWGGGGGRAPGEPRPSARPRSAGVRARDGRVRGGGGERDW